MVEQLVIGVTYTFTMTGPAPAAVQVFEGEVVSKTSTEVTIRLTQATIPFVQGQIVTLNEVNMVAVA